MTSIIFIHRQWTDSIRVVRILNTIVLVKWILWILRTLNLISKNSMTPNIHSCQLNLLVGEHSSRWTISISRRRGNTINDIFINQD